MKDLPEKFESKRCNRWVLILEGVDAFLVKKVELPKLLPGVNSAALYVELHNVVGIDQNAQLLKWLNENAQRAGTLKFLDAVGHVTERWTFNADLVQLSFSTLDYEDQSTFVTHVELKVTDFNIEASK